MTREEAIARIKDHKIVHKMNEPRAIYISEALDMAIKALEHPERNVVAIVSCGDTISRQAVIDLMMQKWGENFSGDDAMQECIDAIRVMPSVTPQEPKIGHWIEVAKYSDGRHEIECSKCGSHIFDRGHANSYIVKEKYKYCPRCGAKMVEPQESEDKE